MLEILWEKHGNKHKRRNAQACTSMHKNGRQLTKKQEIPREMHGNMHKQARQLTKMQIGGVSEFNAVSCQKKCIVPSRPS